MAQPIGKTYWAIAEGYIPPDDTDRPPEFVSHETACLLNTSDQEAHVQITLYFSDREPVGPYHIVVAPRRTKHVRFNDLKDPAVPRGTEYASTIASDVPIVVQHSRLDSRRSDIALLSTIAYAG
ncbi:MULTISPECIES: sensory rhodopsin transducer [unclassified Nodosilinea]|uniref:Sensory rhodopsin transducer n=1 Tax=Leptolyngbya subtilissima DQ-A4 TaxID=2933933 RepID=A0ABV0K963_9CYAN|nr:MULTISPECIES: sensory rhodopsin transducer [unclassified Nodosilinea]MBD2108431.1 sensory rhodopsin transducer [Nodosilinea sp. FACHB-13]MBD2114234.1 sensory rhodopsin transducer [Nodosilinea sp. FACHB-141]